MRLCKLFSVNHTKLNTNEKNTCSKVSYKNTSVPLNFVALLHCLYVVYIVNFEHIECNVQYIFQFRQMYVAATQINLTIKHNFLSSQSLFTTHSLSPARTQNSIYHPHKTINFLNKSTPSFDI